MAVRALIVSHDNERPKGDYKHMDGREERYRFIEVETLMRDFLADVTRLRSTKKGDYSNQPRPGLGAQRNGEAIY